MTAARAALDPSGGLFEVCFDDGTRVTGSVAPNGEVVINSHPCSTQGGMIGALFERQSTCEHGGGLPRLLADLAKASKMEPDMVAAIADCVPKTNPGKAVTVNGLEWHWTGGTWVRGQDLLRPQPIQFPTVAELVDLYVQVDKEYVAMPGLFDRLDSVAGSPMYGSVLLIGPSGHGKSKAARQWCAARNRPCWEITLGIDVRVEDVVGGVGLDNGSTVRRAGLVEILSRPGGTLILNELTAVNQREWTPLWPFLERGTSVVRTVVDGQRVSVPIHPTAMVIATANEAKGLHAEANGGQGFAQLRRLNVIRVAMDAAQVVKVAKAIAKAQLRPATFDLGEGKVGVVGDRTTVLDSLDFDRWGRLAAHLMGSAEAREVLEVSPEILAVAALDGANPAIGVQESLLSHFVLKAGPCGARKR